jgi:D-alanine-D-alanine ligase
MISDLVKHIQKLLAVAAKTKHKTNMLVLATLAEEAANYPDYEKHSVKTSYLTRQELSEIVISLRRFCNYLVLYTDIEDFLHDYYSGNLKVNPTMVFETGAKGIGRGKEALIPALCDILGYPHIGSDATSNILCSSKYQWTSILRSNGIRVPDSYLFINGHWITPPPLGERFIIKLNYECASIGLSLDSLIINDGMNLTTKAIQLQKDYKQPIIAQRYIEGYEVEVPILVNHQFRDALVPVGLALGNQKYYRESFMDYDTIYTDNYDLYSFAEVSPEHSEQLRQCANRIIDILDLSGYMRIDFRVTEDGSFSVFDINNDPSINTSGSFIKSIELLGFKAEDIGGILIGNRLV